MSMKTARVSAAGLGLDAVITVVDASTLGTLSAQARVVRRQVEAADFLVLSKGDLCSAADRAAVRRRLRRWNRRAHLLEAERGRADSDLLFGLGFRRYRAAAPPGPAASAA